MFDEAMLNFSENQTDLIDTLKENVQNVHDTLPTLADTETGTLEVVNAVNELQENLSLLNEAVETEIGELTDKDALIDNLNDKIDDENEIILKAEISEQVQQAADNNIKSAGEMVRPYLQATGAGAALAAVGGIMHSMYLKKKTSEIE